MLVRSVTGAPLFHWDGGSSVRDDNGKVVAGRAATKDDETRRLQDLAASLMTGRAVRREWNDPERKYLLDLAPADVAQQATKAEYGTPLGSEFVADQVSPITYITNDRGAYFAESEVDALQIPLANSSPDAPPQEINPIYGSPTKFVCGGYALAARLPRPIRNNADFDLKARALAILVRKMRLAREYRVATLLQTSTNWAAANRVAAAAKWNGGVTPNPIADMFAAMIKSWLPVDTMVISENVLQYFFGGSSSTATRDYVQAGGPMPNIVVARALFESAGAPAYVWAPSTTVNVPLLRIGQNPTDLQSCVTLRWLGDSSAMDGEGREGMFVRDFWDSATDAYWVVVAHHDTEQIVNNKIGAVITGAVA